VTSEQPVGIDMAWLAASRTYDYDTLNRLITARLTDTQNWVTATEKTTSYNYDDLGNRISHSYRDGEGDQDGSPNIIGYAHDKANRMTTLADKTQACDKAGNLTLAYSTDRGTSYKYAYDPYGRPLIRESAGQADMDTKGDILTSAGSNDLVRFTDSMLGVIWDSRADMDDDGDVDQTDNNLRKTAAYGWYPSRNPVVAQAFSDVGNPFGFQGRVHFAIDTLATATDGKLMLVDHRLRMNDPVTGRWTTRDPIGYADSYNLYQYLQSNSLIWLDPLGLYGKETHLDKTRTEAKKAGFSDSEAEEIATANQKTDDWTNSALTATIINILTLGLLGGEAYDDHFPGAGPPVGEQQYVEAGYDKNKAVLNRIMDALLSCSRKKLGEALHTLQDSFSHEGRPDRGGHPKGRKYDKDGDGSDPVGFGPEGEKESQGRCDKGVDNPNNDKERYKEAIRQTKAVLEAFHQKCGTGKP